jgi:hypothetical protein
MLLKDRDITMARDVQAAQAALDQVNSRADQRTEAEGRRAWQTAFGLPSSANGQTVLALRDAIDRVSKATPREAARLLDQAIATNDPTLTAAVGAHAFSQTSGDPLQSSAWGGVVDAYAQAHPSKQAAISTLAGHAADANDKRAVINRNLMRRVPTPPELRGRDIDVLAAMPLSTEDDRGE